MSTKPRADTSKRSTKPLEDRLLGINYSEIARTCQVTSGFVRRVAQGLAESERVRCEVETARQKARSIRAENVSSHAGYPGTWRIVTPDEERLIRIGRAYLQKVEAENILAEVGI